MSRAMQDEEGKSMAKTYKGTNGVDIVNQNNSNKAYFDIITKGGNDQISVILTNTWVDAGDGADVVTSDIEGANRFDLGGGADTYTGDGFAKNGRHDEVYGGAGNDTMTIHTRQSDYFGGGGDDFISSAGYWNLLVGGDGNDTVSYMAQDDDYLKGWGVYLDLGREFAKTGQGRKEIVDKFENAEGTSYGDDILGSKGNNKLWGMDGNDDVVGFKGDDKLFGGNGKDLLEGGNGKDQLTGGKGVDHMWGGGGNDHFIFTDVNETGVGSGNRDIIKDFENGDKIDLSAAGSFTFIGSAGFSNTAGELRFENGVVSGDVDGDGNADFQIEVKGVNSLQGSDFIL
jgi:serralysin